jgi:uncharacterized SAM-binding protein YcdF (DUF218 family)
MKAAVAHMSKTGNSTPLIKREGRRARRVRVLVWTAALAVAAWPLAAWLAARELVVSAELREADALVVLSGSAAYVERTRLAAELFHEGRAPLILLTDDGERGGWSQQEQRNPSFRERAAAELERRGVPAGQIETLPGLVAGTHEEALRLREYASARNLRSLLVVTSPYHSRRAWWTLRRVFRGSGIETGLAVPARAEQTPPPERWWLERRGWRQVPAEYLKLAYYWMNY